MSVYSLGQQDFLLHHDISWLRDLRETQKEETIALAKTLQHCVQRLWCLLRCYAAWSWISRGVWNSSCASKVKTFWKPHCLRPQTMSQEHPDPSRRSFTLGQWSCTQEAWHTTTGDPKAQNCSQNSRPSGCTEVDTIAISWVWITCLGVLPSSPWRCKTPSQHSLRSPAGYNLFIFHGDDYCQEYPEGWVWILLLNMAYCNDIPTPEPIWGLGLTW